MHIVTPDTSPDIMDQLKNEGDTAFFTCQATGRPVPTISWYFNGVPVNETNAIKYTISTMSLNTTTINNTLTIMNVDSSDVGTYTCNATNVISTDISSGVLTVNGELIILLLILFAFMNFIYNSCPKHHYTTRRTAVLYH